MIPIAYYVPDNGFFLPRKDKSGAKDNAFEKVRHLAIPLYTLVTLEENGHCLMSFMTLYAPGMGSFGKHSSEFAKGNILIALFSVNES